MGKFEGHEPVAVPGQAFRNTEDLRRQPARVDRVATATTLRVPFDGPLGALVRFTSDGIMVVNREGRTLFANQAAAQFLGFTSIEALKRIPVDQLVGSFVIEEGEPDDVFAASARLSEQAWFSQATQVLRFRDPAAGWDRWVRVQSRPFVELQGSHTAFLILIQDMTTERRRESCASFLADASKRLAQSLVRQRILEHAAVAAVPRLADECVIIERSEGVWSPVAWYIPGGGAVERATSLVRNFAPLMVQVETGEHPLLIAPSREGMGMPLSGSMILVPIKRGKALGGAMLLAMAPDTARCHHPTDLSLAEQFAERVSTALTNAELLESEQRRRLINDERMNNARRAVERRDALLVSVAYTLSQQLSPLLSVADLLESRNDPHRLSENLRRQSERLRAVVDTLLKASRISSGSAEFEDQMRRIRELLAAGP